MKTKYDASREWIKEGSWQRGDPFSIVFVYPMEGEPFILKGGWVHCELKLNEFNFPLCYTRLLYCKGKTRGQHMLSFKNLPDNLKVFIYKGMEKRFKYGVFDGEKLLFQKSLRRIPRKFPQDVKDLIKLNII